MEEDTTFLIPKNLRAHAYNTKMSICIKRVTVPNNGTFVNKE